MKNILIAIALVAFSGENPAKVTFYAPTKQEFEQELNKMLDFYDSIHYMYGFKVEYIQSPEKHYQYENDRGHSPRA